MLNEHFSLICTLLFAQTQNPTFVLFDGLNGVGFICECSDAIRLAVLNIYELDDSFLSVIDVCITSFFWQKSMEQFQNDACHCNA